MEQTAVEWLVEGLKGVYQSEYLNKLTKQANEMFKEQIINAHFSAQMEDLHFWDEAKQEALEYYNETFKTNKMNIIQIKKWWCGNNHYAKGGSFNMALYLRILEIKNLQNGNN